MRWWMASRRRVRRKSCEGKRRHTTYANAMVAVRESKRAGFDGDLRCYPCSRCRYWHVGHPKHRESRELRGNYTKREFDTL